MTLTETLFFEYFLLHQLLSGCESSIFTATQMVGFEGRSALTFVVVVENCLPQGQSLKSTEPYLVVPQIYYNFDVMTSFGEVIAKQAIFTKKIEPFCFPSKIRSKQSNN
jgi:hypothetical protein